MELTKKQIIEIMPTAKERVGKYINYMNAYADTFKIDTPLRMAHWLAQVAHESAELKYTAEIASGKSYEGRKDLGNTQPGDGVRYKGRGLIQITGRANYAAYNRSVWCKGDIMKSPELLEKPLGAVKSAMWWWREHDLNRLADEDDVIRITKRVNGGTNGLRERCMYLARAKKALGVTC